MIFYSFCVLIVKKRNNQKNIRKSIYLLNMYYVSKCMKMAKRALAGIVLVDQLANTK